ncbi:hypothetical protein MHYP_G00348730 [Metynnis hypsauchen]
MILILQLLLALSPSLRADPIIQFNSTVGEFVGFTEFGVKNAERWNRGPELQEKRTELDRYCKHNLPIYYSNILDKAAKPKVRLRSEKQASEGHPALLMCGAYDFYPPVIDIYWLRDGQKVTSVVISTEPVANRNWYYQVHSLLEYTPTSGEKISCVVEHASSSEPIIVDWGGSFPDSDRDKIIIGASGFVLGIILSTAGFLYYKKKSPGQIRESSADIDPSGVLMID